MGVSYTFLFMEDGVKLLTVIIMYKGLILFKRHKHGYLSIVYNFVVKKL